MHFVPAVTEPIEFYAFIVLNGNPLPPSLLVITSADRTVDERAIWILGLNQRTNEVRLEMISLGGTTGQGA